MKIEHFFAITLGWRGRFSCNVPTEHSTPPKEVINSEVYRHSHPMLDHKIGPPIECGGYTTNQLLQMGVVGLYRRVIPVPILAWVSYFLQDLESYHSAQMHWQSPQEIEEHRIRCERKEWSKERVYAEIDAYIAQKLPFYQHEYVFSEEDIVDEIFDAPVVLSLMTSAVRREFDFFQFPSGEPASLIMGAAKGNVV